LTDELFAAARDVQQRIEHFYGLERGPDIADFVQLAHDEAGRELLLIRQSGDGIEVSLVLPASAGRCPRAADDTYLQLVEGVSHFVYVAERARVELPSTELELELQAEVDKFVVLAFDGGALARHRAPSVRTALYHRVAFLHAEESERGARYRLANALAARLARRLVETATRTEPRRFLQRFYRAGQSDKLHLASAA
jgi:hypothetical protein